MDWPQIVLEVIHSPDNSHSYYNGCDTRKDSSHHKIRAKDSTVPHGLDSHGKNIRHYRMNRNRDRDNQDRHDGNRYLQPVDLPLSTLPAQGQDFIKPVPDPLDPIPPQRYIRYQ